MDSHLPCTSSLNVFRSNFCSAHTGCAIAQFSFLKLAIPLEVMAYKHGYSAELVAKGRAILDSDDEIGIIKDNFLEFILGNGIGRDVLMKVEDLLVHPSNRGGLLVNAFNSH